MCEAHTESQEYPRPTHWKGYDLGLWTRVGCRLTLNLEKMLVFFETDFVLVLSQNCLKRASIDDQNGNSILTMNLLNWSHATGCGVFRCSQRKVSNFGGPAPRLCNFRGTNTADWGWKQRQTHGHPGRTILAIQPYGRWSSKIVGFGQWLRLWLRLVVYCPRDF